MSVVGGARARVGGKRGYREKRRRVVGGQRTTERAATAPGPRESERGSGNGVGVEETLRGETEDGGREEEASGGRRRAAAAAATAAGADAG